MPGGAKRERGGRAAAGQAPRYAAQQEHTGALMNILLQKFAMSTGAQCRRDQQEELEEQGKLFASSAFYCISFCCSYSRIAARIAQAEAVCPI